MVKLSVNARKVLEARYLLKDKNRRIIETPQQMFMRTAKFIAKEDKKYGLDPKKSEKIFYEMMTNLEFLPNSPTLMNAGTKMNQLSACFVLPIDDSIESIFETVKNTAIIHQSGGGTGFSFSKIRPKGEIIMSTKGTASGPISFMKIIDKTTDVIKQGGKRRGANIGILRVDHPDIIEFIKSKNGSDLLKNFNISAAVTDKFMKTLKNKKEYNITNPITGKIIRKEKAEDIFNLIAENTWKSADPGIIFIDTINKSNPTPFLGKIESTNPCGEIPLYPFESCNLGSINLSKIVKNNQKIDWEKLRELVHNSVHFLDNVIDATKFPLDEIKKITKANRKIGLGVMGFADMLILSGINYNSQEAIKTGEKVMKFIKKESQIKSEELARKRGAFPNFKKSKLRTKRRNATLTAIAPTGTISIIAGCSSGIEPLFAVSYTRNILEGARLSEINKHFKDIAKKNGFYSDKLIKKITRSGSLKNIKEIPMKIRKLFVISHEINPEYHIKMQAGFQKYCDNSISKTINMPNSATVKDVKKAYMLAYDLKCKGVTIYRDGCKKKQVLSFGDRVVCPQCEGN